MADAVQALTQIEAMISGGDRATVNEQNAFEHFTAQNRLLMQIRDIARAALAVSSAAPACTCGGDMAHDYHQDWCPAVPSAMRAPEPLCECLGGSTYNDGAQRRCDVCGLPVPVASRLTSTQRGSAE